MRMHLHLCLMRCHLLSLLTFTLLLIAVWIPVAEGAPRLPKFSFHSESKSSSGWSSLFSKLAQLGPPERGKSPFPFQPFKGVDPTNNPQGLIPAKPHNMCEPLDFQCQAYKRCYPCYATITLPFCPICFNLIHCTTADCQLKEMCNLCHASQGLTPDQAMMGCQPAEPYCPL